MPSTSATKISKTDTSPTSNAPTGAAPGPGEHTTDVVYQEVRLYVEGVQVPFEAISISQNIGQLPRAEIQVPPQSGLMDICRYYQPKVHIFYHDQNLGGFRLLFWGHINASSFQRSRSGTGSSSIRFSAEHKNSLLRQVTLDYAGYVTDQDVSKIDSGAALKVNNLNSLYSVINALQGVSGVQSEAKDFLGYGNADVTNADVTKLPVSLSELHPRYVGMTGVSINLWNQLKRAVFQNERINTVMAGMLIPMVEDGIAYFKRLSGHPFLELQIEEDREQYCLHSGTDAKVLVPPMYALNLKSAVKAKLAVETTLSQIQFSGEMTSFLELLENFYFSVGYEVITLASPSEVPVDPTKFEPDGRDRVSKSKLLAIETIVKPQLPFYYSPACNVIYPKMFSSIQVGQEETELPTRVTATHDSMPGTPGSYGVNYRGPHSIREAIAYAKTLTDDGSSGALPSLSGTMELSHNAPGRYEQGRGFKHLKIGIPWWLQTLARDEGAKGGGTTGGQYPDKSSPQYQDLLALEASWRERNGYKVTDIEGVEKRERAVEKDGLNPYSYSSGLQPHQSLLFTNVDYEFTKKMVSSRTGMVECVFNPYIVPGYPMDVLDDSPNHPSFHALCSSVTHSITSRGISTTVGMLAVQTYAELSNYYTPPAPPYLQTALGIVSVEGQGGEDYGSTSGMTVKNAGSLLFNEEASANADAYYRSTLGVRSADPTLLIDWSTGQPLPQQRIDGGIAPGVKDVLRTSNGGDANDYNTTVGNLRLVTRPIETKDSIEDKFSYAFVDLTPENYSGTPVEVTNAKLTQEQYLEPGASPFLDYMETRDFINAIRSVASSAPGGEVAEATPNRRYSTQ